MDGNPYASANASAYTSFMALVAAYGDSGLPCFSSTFGNPGSSPYTAQLDAYTNLLTFASRAAISMLRKPVTLLRWHPSGSLIDWGTDPSAASCNTKSTAAHASRHAAKSPISPCMKRKLPHCCGLDKAFAPQTSCNLPGGLLL